MSTKPSTVGRVAVQILQLQISGFTRTDQDLRTQTVMEVHLDLLRIEHQSRMAANNDDCHTGDDIDTLTVMNEDILPELPSPSDARYQRAVSWICEVLEQRTN
jgi:hypothetical protein